MLTCVFVAPCPDLFPIVSNTLFGGIVPACNFHAQQTVGAMRGTRRSSLSSVLKTEQDRQKEYALTSDFNPERDLLRECRSTKEVDENDDETLRASTLPILDELNKMRNIPGQKGIWRDVQESLPNDESERVGQRFWAVLIGNNKYNDARELYGEISFTQYGSLLNIVQVALTILN